MKTSKLILVVAGLFVIWNASDPSVKETDKDQDSNTKNEKVITFQVEMLQVC